MKTFEIPKAANTQAQNDLATATQGQGQHAQDPNLQLKQRLWQLLLPLPEIGAIQSSPAQASRAGTADGRDTRTAARTNGLTSELVSTAYLLAAHIQQLTLWDVTSAVVESQKDVTQISSDPAYTVRLESASDGGGLASVDLTHPELGSVSLSIELSDGAVRVTATADSPRSAQVIADGQAILTERLARQGVVLEVLEVLVVVNNRKNKSRARARARRQET
jgi:hypothetical protein